MSSNFLQIATSTVFFWFSQKLAYVICVPLRKKTCGTDFLNFDLEIFGRI